MCWLRCRKRAPASPRLSGRTAGPSTSPDEATGWPTATPSPFDSQGHAGALLHVPWLSQGSVRLRRLLDRTHARPRPRLRAWQHAGDARRARGRAARQQRLYAGARSAALPRRRPARRIGRQPAAGSRPGSSSGRSAPSVLFGDRTFDTAGAVVSPVVPNYSQQRTRWSTSMACSACPTGSTPRRS